MHWPAGRTLPGMPRKTPSEQRFERYLEAQGHAFEFEPDLGTHFKPDYKVLLASTDVVVEVKEFETNWLTERLSAIGAADAGRPTRAVRKGVRRAIEQVGELAGRGLPLVIVVSNPHQADVDLDPERVWATLYYDDGPLQDNRADHVSAIAILHRRTAVQDWSEENVRRLGPLEALRVALRADSEGTAPEGETLYVTVLPTLSETATPLPAELFAGEADTVWRPPPAHAR
jgi:hypothetical protein